MADIDRMMEEEFSATIQQQIMDEENFNQYQSLM